MVGQRAFVAQKQEAGRRDQPLSSGRTEGNGTHGKKPPSQDPLHNPSLTSSHQCQQEAILPYILKCPTRAEGPITFANAHTQFLR